MLACFVFVLIAISTWLLFVLLHLMFFWTSKINSWRCSVYARIQSFVATTRKQSQNAFGQSCLILNEKKYVLEGVAE